jgi:GPH family glycoside/pentoside/hexuronide:cation symporter
MSRVVPAGTLVRYGIGQAGAQVLRDTPAVLLPLFMTTLLGVPAWMAGVAVIVPKLWIIVSDPLVGALSDRHKARFGRTPFLVAGAILSNIGLVAMFSLSGFSSPILAACAVSLLFLLTSTGFSAFSVPYLALASEVSRDAYQRSRLIAARMGGAVLGVVVGIGLPQPLIGAFGGGAGAWHRMAVILGVVCFTTMLVTAVTMRNRIERAPQEIEQSGLFHAILEALREREFRWLSLTFFLQCTSQACSFTVVGFVFLYCVGNVNLILPFVLLMSVFSLISQPIWLRMARRWGMPTCFMAANIGYILVSITAFYITPGDDVLMTLPFTGPLSTQQVIVLARAIPLAFLNCGFLLFVFSMLTDTIGRVRARNGDSVNEGVFSGIFSAVEKLSFAVAPLLGGIVLSASGFVSSTGGITTQSASALTGILAMYALVPAGIIALSVAAFLRYQRASGIAVEVPPSVTDMQPA